MEVDFVKISPTQNMTILVTSPAERHLHKELAAKIMAYDNVYAEQVGFVEKPSDPKAAARLQMAGGEFCGNAALSLCAYLVWSGKVSCDAKSPASEAQIFSVPIEVSGADGIINCNIKRKGQHFLGKMNMPVPSSIKMFDLQIEGVSRTLPVVHLPGISHVIVETDETGINKEAFAETLIENSSHFSSEEAIGIMFYDKSSSSIIPFVCVKSSCTKVWERGCGSGTAATGAYLAFKSGGNFKMGISQPGGLIAVEVTAEDGKITNITIEGKIEIAAYGTALLEI